MTDFDHLSSSFHEDAVRHSADIYDHGGVEDRRQDIRFRRRNPLSLRVHICTLPGHMLIWTMWKVMPPQGRRRFLFGSMRRDANTTAVF